MYIITGLKEKLRKIGMRYGLNPDHPDFYFRLALIYAIRKEPEFRTHPKRWTESDDIELLLAVEERVSRGASVAAACGHLAKADRWKIAVKQQGRRDPKRTVGDALRERVVRIRRNLATEGDVVHLFANAPEGTPLEQITPDQLHVVQIKRRRKSTIK
jgi:hypothetical protein